MNTSGHRPLHPEILLLRAMMAITGSMGMNARNHRTLVLGGERNGCKPIIRERCGRSHSTASLCQNGCVGTITRESVHPIAHDHPIRGAAQIGWQAPGPPRCRSTNPRLTAIPRPITYRPYFHTLMIVSKPCRFCCFRRLEPSGPIFDWTAGLADSCGWGLDQPQPITPLISRKSWIAQSAYSRPLPDCL